MMDKQSSSNELPENGGPAASRSDNSLSGPAALARRADFRLGAALVRPSVRTIEGPAGSIPVEPRVMQVLVALADADGAVLSRDELMRICWSGTVVGEDALSRTIGEIRRVARSSGEEFSIETIPRVGYRLLRREVAAELTTALAAPTPDADVPAPEGAKLSWSDSPRRRWFIAGAVALAATGAYGMWRGMNPRPPRRFGELLTTARDLLRIDLPSEQEHIVTLLDEAVGLSPESAAAWGLLSLAYFNVSSSASRQRAATAVQASTRAVGRALEIDKNEPYALATRVLLERRLDDWFVTEQKLRSLLKIAPENEVALDYLTAQLQAAGCIGESWALNERALGYDPLRPTPLARRALKLWISGKPGEADIAAAGALDLYPAHPLVWNFRLLLFAFTDRWPAARLLLEEQGAKPTMLTSAACDAWRIWLNALQSRSSADITRARTAALSVANTNPGTAVHSIMSMAALGEVDAAYAIIDGLLLRKGELVTRSPVRDAVRLEDKHSWRGTQWLFTPATASLRRDERFAALCDIIGLSRYWQRRGGGPDERRSG